MSTYFVVRDTNHPQEDLERNWSTPCSGFSSELAGSVFNTKEEAEEAEIKYFGQVEHEFRYHAAHESFVELHYEGLGAYVLDSETIEEALIEANNYHDDLACTMEAGDGHFYAQDVVSFHKVREGRYIFEIKC